MDEQKLSGVDPLEGKAYIQSLGYDFTKEEMMEAMLDHGISVSMDEAELIAGGGAKHPATATAEALAGVAALGLFRFMAVAALA